MSNTHGNDETYPSKTPLEDEPERFIEGSKESDEAQSPDPSNDSDAGSDETNTGSNETNANDDGAAVNDG